MSREEITKVENYYDRVIIQDSLPETLETLKLLFQTEGYSFGDVLATQQSDIVLVDIIRESFNKPFNGEAFRKLSGDKIMAVNRLNKILQTQIKSQTVTVKELPKAILKQALPCVVKVMRSQKTLAAYLVDEISDLSAIFAKLKTYETSDVKLWLQPYRKNLYRLQITSFNDRAIPVALWEEKNYIKAGEVQESMRVLVNLGRVINLAK